MSKANDKQVGGDHYKEGGDFEHWDLISNHGIGYLEGCATKYISRWRKKEGLQDLEKAQHYVEKLIEGDQSMSAYAPIHAVNQFADANGLIENEKAAVGLLCSNYTIDDLHTVLLLIDDLKLKACIMEEKKTSQQKTIELANKIIDICNNYDLQTVLTVLASTSGQLIAHTSDGILVKAMLQVKDFAKGVQNAVNGKLIHDADAKKKETRH